MSGISLVTALEIFSNPNDLEISIKQEGGGTFSIEISRGPGHNFKLLLTTTPFPATKEDAVAVVVEILQGIHKISTEELRSRTGIVSQILNPEGLEISRSSTLNLDRITLIANELRRNGRASTYRMFRPS